jgi:LacI family transcriptional regulator
VQNYIAFSFEGFQVLFSPVHRLASAGCPMPRSAAEKRTIAVGLKLWATFSNRAIDGILGFARQHAGYEFRDLIWSEAEQLSEQLAGVRPDGAILSLTSVEYEKIRDQIPPDLPLVSIGADTIDERVGVVCSDDRAMMSLAVDHLRGAGYHRIAFVGWKGSAGTARREAILRRACRSVDVFHVALHGPVVEDLDASTRRALKSWIRGLRTPVGVVAWSGTIARHVQREATHADRRVPQDVGIVSLADDRSCLVADPAISAMDVDGERLGQRAMSMLAAMLRGQKPPSEPQMVPPASVIARGSTAALPQSADTIATALHYIEENALRGIVVKNVLAMLPGVGRTRFYADFTERVGCSPADYIRRLKISHAKKLLRETELTVTRIAAMCGFTSTTQFGDTFKREVGVTPQAFRRRGK